MPGIISPITCLVSLLLAGMLAAAESKPVPVDPSTNWVDVLANDMANPHEARPQGVPDGVNWAAKPRLGMGNKMPKDWSATTMWGQIYPAKDGNPATNVRVQIRNPVMYFLSRKDGKWHPLQGEVTVDGAAYRQDFANDANVKADIRTETDGSVSVKLTPGYNYHFWPKKGRVNIDREDIAGMVSGFAARLVVEDPAKPDDRGKARLLGSCGGDYWRSVQASWKADWSNNGDWAIGRFKFIKNDWTVFTAATIDQETLRKNPPPSYAPTPKTP
jgi:hypothetical protein